MKVDDRTGKGLLAQERLGKTVCSRFQEEYSDVQAAGEVQVNV